VVKKLIEIIRLRNENPAFDGDFMIEKTPDHLLSILWKRDSAKAHLMVDLSAMKAEMVFSEPNSQKTILVG